MTIRISEKDQDMLMLRFIIAFNKRQAKGKMCYRWFRDYSGEVVVEWV